MDKKNNMVEVAAECFLPKGVRGSTQMVQVQQQEQADEQEAQLSNVPNFAAIAAACFLPKG